jgi:hypothetical protein
MVAFNRRVGLLIALFLIAEPTRHAAAMMEQPRPIETPIPQKFRAPVARFLSDFGINDVDATMSSSAGFEWQDSDRAPDRIVFRVVHPSACSMDQDECVTVIAHADNGALVPEAMFTAGRKINRGDVAGSGFAVRNSFPWYFYSKTSVIRIIETVKGGFIVSGSPLESNR